MARAVTRGLKRYQSVDAYEKTRFYQLRSVASTFPKLIAIIVPSNGNESGIKPITGLTDIKGISRAKTATVNPSYSSLQARRFFSYSRQFFHAYVVKP